MRDMHADPIMAITAAAALVVLSCDSPEHAVRVSVPRKVPAATAWAGAPSPR